MNSRAKAGGAGDGPLPGKKNGSCYQCCASLGGFGLCVGQGGGGLVDEKKMPGMNIAVSAAIQAPTKNHLETPWFWCGPLGTARKHSSFIHTGGGGYLYRGYFAGELPGAIQQRIQSSHMPPCHRHMVIATNFSSMFDLLLCSTPQTWAGGGGGGRA